MVLPQAKFREAVFYAMFSWDFLKESEEEIVSMLMGQLAMSKKNVREAVAYAEKVAEKVLFLDETIEEKIKDYHLQTISYIERNILRLATYEIFFDDTVPGVVAISEGIRLCRKFGTPEAAQFINGVLDAVYKNQEALKLSSE
jgi:transcription antitermination protein NusB